MSASSGDESLVPGKILDDGGGDIISRTITVSRYGLHGY